MNNLEYDEESDSLYVKISNKKSSFTVELSSRIGVDVSSDMVPIGVEMLDASKVISDMFSKNISKAQVKRLLCKITQKDALYVNFELDKQNAVLTLPLAYQSPILHH